MLNLCISFTIVYSFMELNWTEVCYQHCCWTFCNLDNCYHGYSCDKAFEVGGGCGSCIWLVVLSINTLYTVGPFGFVLYTSWTVPVCYYLLVSCFGKEHAFILMAPASVIMMAFTLAVSSVTVECILCVVQPPTTTPYILALHIDTTT